MQTSIIFNFEILNEYKQKIDNITKSLDIDKQQIIIEELNIKMSDPDFFKVYTQQEIVKMYKDLNTAQEKIKYIKYLNDNIDIIYNIYDDIKNKNDESLIFYINECFNEFLYQYNEFEQKYYNIDTNDKLNAVVQITAGSGGTESNDWTKMLFRMYDMWCNDNGYKLSIQYCSEGDKVGIKSIIFNVEGDNAYGKLKSETGVHRMVRVSPFNAQGKRMTSFAAVFVSPLINDDIKVELDNSKLEYEYFRCSGAGGQNVNKVNSGVRARYKYIDPDTGKEELILVANTETRDQPKNKENATRILKSILYQKMLDKKLSKKKEIENSKTENGWGNQIRSYVFDDKRVKDHRTGYQTTDIDSVMNGNINPFIESYLNYLIEKNSKSL